MKAGWMAVLWMGCAVGATGQDAKPMAAEAHPAFEVAAIKLTPPDDQSQGFRADGNGLFVENETVRAMLLFAYNLHAKQLTGEPAWVDETAYDVRGRLDTAGEPNTKQYQEAVRKLLADQFGLKVHRDKREMGYFGLRTAGTPKIKQAANPDAGSDQTGNGSSKGMTMRFTSNTMDEFLLCLEDYTDRPVVNETGLAGRWDFTLRWMPDAMQVSDVPADAAPGLFTAVKEELGLKLEPAKGMVEVLVVDGVLRPSGN